MASLFVGPLRAFSTALDNTCRLRPSANALERKNSFREEEIGRLLVLNRK